MNTFKSWIFLFTSNALYALTTLNVTVNTDNNPVGFGEIGDLRYCLNVMNQNLQLTPDDYAIVFDFPMTIELNAILPIINNSSNPVNITIGNSGSTPKVILDGNNKTYRGFFIPTGNVTIQNITFQNMLAKGGDGGNGISGGGGGLGAGGAIYAATSFLNGENPSITLMNVSINECSAVGGNGGNGGNYLGSSFTGNEGGGGGLGSCANMGTLMNLGHGGDDEDLGQDGSDGYGGAGGAGTRAFDASYTVEGGSGGMGGGGGADQSGTTSAGGGNSLGGGGGGGAGPSNGLEALGGTDIGYLGGGAGGAGSSELGTDYGGGGGGGGGSGLGGAIFVDSYLNLTLQAFSGIPTTFNTSNTTTQAGIHGTGGPGASDGVDGSALGNSIFLRSGASLTLMANNTTDLLTLGEQVAFSDDTAFDSGYTTIFVKGNGTVIYNGTTDYAGVININNANFKVNGLISTASIRVCRNRNFSLQRGTLSGSGTLTGNVFVNSGTISPDAAQTLSLGSLTLNAANTDLGTLGSLVHININSGSIPSVVAISGAASLAGVLEMDLDPNVQIGTYQILTSSALTGTFNSVTFVGATPNYSLSYVPVESPTSVQFEFLGYLNAPSNLQGKQKKNNFGLEYELYNELTWTASSSSDINGYYIYRDGTKIATVDTSIHTYKDRNRQKGSSYTYSITAFNSESESSELTIVITP